MGIDWRERNPQKLEDAIRRELDKQQRGQPARVAPIEKLPSLREYLNRLRNPFFGHMLDTVKRVKLKAELLAACRKLPPRGMIQFKLRPHDEAYALFALIVEEIRRDHPEFGVIRWKGGNAIIRTADEELLRVMDPTLHATNFASGHMERGG